MTREAAPTSSIRRWIVVGVFVWSAGMVVEAVRDQPDPRSLDAVLLAYRTGDFGVVARTFTRSPDFHRTPAGDGPRLERWLGTWEPRKALLVLDLADVSTTVAPQYTRMLLGVGRRYVTRGAFVAGQVPLHAAFVRDWHLTAIALLQGGGASEAVDDYLDELRRQPATGAFTDVRLTLARAIALEQRCWQSRPSLLQDGRDVRDLIALSGARLRDEASRDRRRRLDAHQACLLELLTSFEAAAGAPTTSAEARVRSAWTLVQLGRAEDALHRLDRADSGADRELRYWASLFRGRALDALARHRESAEAYRAALSTHPRAQTAGVGLALALFRSDGVEGADRLARTLRASAGTPGDDPWWTYLKGDRRFVAGWMARLREALP
jgi:tetratricopeptide (TPR) repeat protein